MTPIDLVALLVVLAYAVIGWFSGTIRRVLGLLAVWVAMLAATNMGQPGAGILRQYNNTISIPDARLAGWLFFFVLLILIFEAAGTAVHAQLQLAAVAVNRGIGLLLGLVTAGVVLIGCTYMLIGFANAQTNQPTSFQVSVRDQMIHSGFLLPLARSAGPPVLLFLNGALPRDPKAYFIYEGPRQ